MTDVTASALADALSDRYHLDRELGRGKDQVRVERRLSWLLILAIPASGPVLAQSSPHPDRRFFELGDFRLESGNILPHARMLYVTYGRLNTARDNAVVTLSYHGGNHHGYDFLLGPAGGLDTTRYFVIATEMFGAGGSSSPSNTPTPYNGPRFSQTTIRDNVAAIPSPAAPRASSCSRSGSA